MYLHIHTHTQRKEKQRRTHIARTEFTMITVNEWFTGNNNYNIKVNIIRLYFKKESYKMERELMKVRER